jgi:hypothetical protein
MSEREWFRIQVGKGREGLGYRYKRTLPPPQVAGGSVFM